MTDGDTDSAGLFDLRSLRSRVWAGPDGRAVCLVSPSDTPADGVDSRWLYAAGDAFVDAAEHY